MIPPQDPAEIHRRPGWHQLPRASPILECSPDAINHVLRGWSPTASIAISGEAENKRRQYRITHGRNALESSTTKDKA